MTPTNKMTGGDAINRALQHYGAHTCFALAGTAHAHLLLSMEKHKAQYPWTFISGRHETATVAAADGYARASGKLGIAMIVGEQGIPNAMTGICTAQAACSPVVVLATTRGLGQIEAAGDADSFEMAAPHVKWARMVPDVNRLEEYVHVAARQALSGRPGVAVLGIPMGMEAQTAEIADRGTTSLALPPNPEPDEDAIARAAELIVNAKRPMILAGTGAALSGAGLALRKLAADYGIPVLANALGRGLVPEDLTLGFPWPLAQVAAKDADLVLAIGLRFTQRFGYGLPPRFSSAAKVIQVDVHAEELGRNRIPDLPIVGDARRTLERLDEALAIWGMEKRDTGWINQAMAVRQARIAELGNDASAPIHPYRMMRELMKQMPADAIYAGDGADIQNWSHAILRISGERAYMDHYPFGSMGVGTPLAIGAAAAMKEEAAANGTPVRPVVLVTGDGAFGFYPSEFNAATMAGLKIVCLISNDAGWGTEKHGQIKNMGTHINCELGHCDYHLIGQAFGCHGVRVENPADIAPALQRAFASDGTTVINVITDPDAGMVRKTDPRVQTIAFEDIVSSLKTHYAPDVA